MSEKTEQPIGRAIRVGGPLYHTARTWFAALTGGLIGLIVVVLSLVAWQVVERRHQLKHSNGRIRIEETAICDLKRHDESVARRHGETATIVLPALRGCGK